VNSKTILAFVLGCVAAGAAMFLFTSPPSKKAVPPSQAADPVVVEKPAITPTAPVEEPAKPVVVAEAPKPAPVPAAVPQRHGFTRAASSEPVRTKPSPVKLPVVVAKAEEKVVVTPPVAATPAPAPAEPVVHQPLKMEVPPPPAPTEPVVVVKKELPPPPPPKPNTVTIAAGTMLSIRLQEALSSDRNMAGDSFQGVLEQPVVIDGFVIAEKGSRVEGKVLEVDRGGRVKGTARLVLEVTKINTSDGQRVAVQTSAFERKAEQSKKSDALKVGLGAAIGAAIGGIAGGGKGAATGAGVGGAAGAGGVLMTRGKEASLAVESRLSFRLQEPVTLTERLSN
jgi:hypothetical protein